MENPFPPGPFDVIYADPPWQYSRGTTTPKRAIEHQYQTLTLEGICELPVAEIAAPNCVLFLWATAPLLPEGLLVASRWGFSYKTNIAWCKTTGFGLGHWVRGQHEHLLIATRGRVSPPEAGHHLASVIHAPRSRHSRKPQQARDYIVEMFPKSRRVELFAREADVGWETWGNEIATPVHSLLFKPSALDAARRGVVYNEDESAPKSEGDGAKASSL